MRSSSRLLPFAALGVTGLVTATALTPPAEAAGFGLPPLSAADRYVMTPASRVVAPASVSESHAVNADYVTAASPSSETDGHALVAGSSTVAKVDGVQVRRAGENAAGASFGYTLKVPRGQKVRLRVEEAGSPTSHYQVLVNGRVVYERKPDSAQAGVWSNLSGLVHYDVALPAGSADSINVTFRNMDTPGHGARVHAVWTLAGGGRTAAPYGGTVSDPRGALGRGTTTLRSDAYGRPYVVYDFGKEVGGKVRFRADSLKGDAKIGLAFSESTQYLTTSSDYSQDPVGLATETHYVTAAKDRSTVADPVIRGGFRYLMVFLAEPGEVKLSDLRLDFTADPANPAPARYKGAFLSSDDTLNRLWYSGAYTVQLATIDPKTGRPYPGKEGPVTNDAIIGDGDSVITDGGKRDRMIWGGDNAVSDVVSYLSTGRPGPAENAVAFMAKGQAASGQIPGLFLTDKQGYNLGWGEYAEWWVQNYWEHYLYTGDKAFLDRWYDAMKKNVAWLESKADGDGVLDLKGAGGTWGYGNEGKGTYTSSLYVRILGLAAQAAEAKGDAALAKTYRGQATRTAAGVNKQFWDAAAGAYRVGPSDAAHPQDGNAMAVLSGVATGDRANAVLKFFGGSLAGKYGDLTVDKDGSVVPRYISPFVSNSALLAHVSQGDTNGAMSLLRRTWAPMLERGKPGTLWENVNPDGAPRLGSYTSMAHGWAAGPTSFLTNQVLGVTPTSGGFATFSVLPHPSSGLRWAQGRVPTPAGDITAAWKTSGHTFTLQLVAPRSTSAMGGVPADGVREVELGGTTVWRAGKALRPGVVVRDGLIQVPGLTGTATLTAVRG
ncbi:hypothetical protein J4573_28190 [Actinomadura barringtoniae]|uniref:Alpha-L-rhamnosidase n=1 Tax=Actinomadura barringtoniae TaxID=1427535 RepID=A0A939PJ43_9ACTN|nr:alpha-L-rhamnosidase C-terminal domain-containing protein [Actinomadura barringtoniae]MBO2451008.1 hypothetical protein [Actinomadura barringtoniae]